MLARSAWTVRMSFLRTRRISRTAMLLASPRSATLEATAIGVAGSCSWAWAAPVSARRAVHRAARVLRDVMRWVPSRVGMIDASLGGWLGRRDGGLGHRAGCTRRADGRGFFGGGPGLDPRPPRGGGGGPPPTPLPP